MSSDVTVIQILPFLVAVVTAVWAIAKISGAVNGLKVEVGYLKDTHRKLEKHLDRQSEQLADQKGQLIQLREEVRLVNRIVCGREANTPNSP